MFEEVLSVSRVLWVESSIDTRRLVVGSMFKIANDYFKTNNRIGWSFGLFKQKNNFLLICSTLGSDQSQIIRILAELMGEIAKKVDKWILGNFGFF